MAMSEEKTQPTPESDDRAVEAEMARRTRRSFVTGGLAALAGFGVFEFVRNSHREGQAPWPLRQALETNEELSRAYYRPARLAPGFPVSEAESVKVNGDIGIDDDDFDAAKWSLTVDGLAGDDDSAVLSLADVRALPRVDMVTEFKCIEGWSKKVRWAGARFADFARKYQPASDSRDSYVALETPDRAYYVGIDLPSMMHPQTLLCYEMNGEPLEPDHGAPLRLVIPIRYGIKNLKRIGRIAYTASRPPDYWAERGYDYYSGF
jgi:DMSO/TMAO reductase YedYZ molybdopterin-dependent catalytic subunit